MKCPNCGDEITGVAMQLTTSGVIYKEEEGEPAADLCSYPELEADTVEADTAAQCMDCGYEAHLRDFFPGDVNA